MPAAAVALLLGLLLSGCSLDVDRGDAAPAATTECEPVEFPPLQFGSHLLEEGQPPVPYSSVPPTSGWHASGAPPLGIFAAPLTDPSIVSALEVGLVVLAHDGLAGEQLDTLIATVQSDYADRVTVTPYPDLPSPGVTMLSWGALQRCRAVDIAAVRAYVEAYAEVVEHG